MAEIHNVKDVRVVDKILTVRIDGTIYTFDLPRHSKRLAENSVMTGSPPPRG
jgi:hypothetical protein